MTARVLCVTAFSSRSRSIVRVAESMSTKTGLAPTSRTTLLVATQERGVVITSSPGPTPAIRSAISIVQVPELNTRTGRPPKYSESLASNAFTWGPDESHPERMTSATPAIVASSMVGLVKGRNGSTSWGGAAAGDGMAGGILRGAGQSSRLVAEKIVVLPPHEHVVVEIRVRKELPDVADPCHGEYPARARPLAAELGVIDEPGAALGRVQELEFQLVRVLDEPDKAPR